MNRYYDNTNWDLLSPFPPHFLFTKYIPSPQILSPSFHSSFAVSEPFSQEFRSHTLLFASLLSIILDLSFCGRQSNEDLQEISVMEVGVYCTIVKRGIMPH